MTASELLFHIEPTTLHNKYTLRSLPACEEGFVWVWGANKSKLKSLGLTIHATHNRHYNWFYLLEKAEIVKKIDPYDYDYKCLLGGHVYPHKELEEMTAKIDENGNGPAPSEQDVKIGNVSAISSVSLDLDELHGKLQRLRATTTCSNIDNAIAHIGFAIDQLEEYFKWAGDDGEPTGED